MSERTTARRRARGRSRRLLGLAASLAAFSLAGCTSLSTALVTSEFGGVVMAVDLESNAVIGTVDLPANAVPPGGLRTVLMATGTVGYANGAGAQVHVVNVKSSEVVLGANSPVSFPGGARVLATSKSNPWLVAASAGTGSTFTLAAINPLNNAVQSSVTLPAFPRQADVCDDGQSVLVLTSDGALRLLNLTTGGTISDTGQVMPLTPLPLAVACAPGSGAAAVLLSGPDDSFRSFTFDSQAGFAQVDSGQSFAYAQKKLGPVSNALAFSMDGTALFVRSSSILGNNQDGWIERFGFDPATAQIGNSATFTETAGVSYTMGLEQIGVNPDGSVIYLPNNFLQQGQVRIRDALTGAHVGVITHPNMPKPRVFTVVSD